MRLRWGQWRRVGVSAAGVAAAAVRSIVAAGLAEAPPRATSLVQSVDVINCATVAINFLGFNQCRMSTIKYHRVTNPSNTTKSPTHYGWASSSESDFKKFNLKFDSKPPPLFKVVNAPTLSRPGTCVHSQSRGPTLGHPLERQVKVAAWRLHQSDERMPQTLQSSWPWRACSAYTWALCSARICDCGAAPRCTHHAQRQRQSDNAPLNQQHSLLLKHLRLYPLLPPADGLSVIPM